MYALQFCNCFSLQFDSPARVRVRYCSAGSVLTENCLTKEELRIVSLKDTMMGEFVYHHFKKDASVNGVLPQ